MLPLQDINPTRRFPVLTYALIGINVLVFIWEMTQPEVQLQRIFIELSVVPANVAGNWFSPENILDIIRSMFFHGGFDHIIGNMLYLFLFGDNVEDRLGVVLYLIFYFIGGFVAAYAQVLIDPTSTIPLIGASGAIAAVLGGYLVLFPGVQVRGIILLGWIGRVSEFPAWLVLGFWFVQQLFSGFASLGVDAAYGGGVAFFAHIGGFVAGAVLMFVFIQFMPQPPVEDRYEMLYQRQQRGRF